MSAKNLDWGVVLAVVALLCGASVAPGSVVTVGLWRLGENDPGAASGNPVNAATVDALGARNLTKNGSSSSFLYTNSTPGAASTLAMNWPNVSGNYYLYSGYGTALGLSITSNFGFEVWLRPQTDSARHDPIWFNSTAGTPTNLGFYQSAASTLTAHMTNVGDIGNYAFTSGQWADYAIVHTYNAGNHTTTAYVNGVSIGSRTNVYNMGAGDLMLGANSSNFDWNGGIDNLRFFTFANPGDFNPTSDLTLSLASQEPTDIPEPATMALLGLAATGLGGYLRRRRAA